MSLPMFYSRLNRPPGCSLMYLYRSTTYSSSTASISPSFTRLLNSSTVIIVFISMGYLASKSNSLDNFSYHHISSGIWTMIVKAKNTHSSGKSHGWWSEVLHEYIPDHTARNPLRSMHYPKYRWQCLNIIALLVPHFDLFINYLLIVPPVERNKIPKNIGNAPYEWRLFSKSKPWICHA